jgi:SEC-C motif
MSRQKVSRNAPCPCGSGKKYKHCCYGKGFDYQEDDDGTIFKSIPMTPEMTEILDEQRRAFIEKFGREPGPNDPVFFDLPHPEHLEHLTVEAMKKAGLDPAVIYAYEKTGRIVTEENQHLLSEADLGEWDAAIEEYEMKHRKKQEPPQYPIGTVALYGPDDKRTTKIAAGVILRDGAEPIIKRWVATEVTTNPKVQQEMQEFFMQHGVKSVAMSEGNMGCPHEEGLDFPDGEDCPFCPFWKGKQGSNRRD